MDEEYIVYDFRELKYQANPDLVIEACLNAEDPASSLLLTIAALDVCGYSDMAARVWKSCPMYGIDFDSVDLEI